MHEILSNYFKNKRGLEILSNYFKNKPIFFPTTSKKIQKGSLIPKIISTYSRDNINRIFEILSNIFKNQTQEVPLMLSNHFQIISKRKHKGSMRVFQITSKTRFPLNYCKNKTQGSLRFFQITSKARHGIPRFFQTTSKRKQKRPPRFFETTLKARQEISDIL